MKIYYAEKEEHAEMPSVSYEVPSLWGHWKISLHIGIHINMHGHVVGAPKNTDTSDNTTGIWQVATE